MKTLRVQQRVRNWKNPQNPLSWSITKAFREKNLGLATLISHNGTRENWTRRSFVRSAHLLTDFIPLELNNMTSQLFLQQLVILSSYVYVFNERRLLLRMRRYCCFRSIMCWTYYIVPFMATTQTKCLEQDIKQIPAILLQVVVVRHLIWRQTPKLCITVY